MAVSAWKRLVLPLLGQNCAGGEDSLVMEEEVL